MIDETFILLSIVFGFAALAILILTILYKELGLYLLVVTLPLAELLRSDALPTTLLIVPAGLALLSLIVSFLMTRKKLIVNLPVFFGSLFLGIWATLATFMSGNAAESRPYWLVIILLFIVSNLISKPRHLLLIAWLWVISLSITGVYVFINQIFSFFTIRNLDVNILHATNSALGDKNIVGMWLTLGLPFAINLFEYYKHNSLKRLWLVLAGIALVGGSLATLSIGVFIGMVAILVLTIFLQQTQSKKMIYIFFSAFLVMAAFVGPLQERLQQQTGLNAGWGSYRASTWKAGVKIIQDNSLWGVGLNAERVNRQFSPYLANVPFITYWITRGELIVPHNMLISVGIELGIPGLFFYIALFVSILIPFYRTGMRTYSRLQEPNMLFLNYFFRMCFCALAAALIQGFALSVHLNKHTWFLLGCAIVYCSLVPRRTDNQLR